MIIEYISSLVSIYLIILSFVLDRSLKNSIEQCYNEDVSDLLILVAKGWETNMTVLNVGIGLLFSILVLSINVGKLYLWYFFGVCCLLFLGTVIYIFSSKDPSWAPSKLIDTTFFPFHFRITMATTAKVVLLISHAVLIILIYYSSNPDDITPILNK